MFYFTTARRVLGFLKGADDLQIRTAVQNKSQTSDKGWRSNLDAGRGANNTSSHKKIYKTSGFIKSEELLEWPSDWYPLMTVSSIERA